MHWAGGSTLQAAAAIFLVALFIPYYTYIRYSKSKHVEASFIYLIAAVSWICMFGMLVSLSRPKNIILSLRSSQFMLEQQKDEFEYRNESLYSLLPVSGSLDSTQHLKQIADELDVYIQGLKTEIIRNLDETNLPAINEGSIDLSLLHDDTNTNAPFRILIGGNQSGKSKELKQKIGTTRNEMIVLAKQDETVTKIINSLLNTDLPEEAPEWAASWEMLWFSRTSAAGSIEVLTAIQRNLRMAENEVINYIMNY